MLRVVSSAGPFVGIIKMIPSDLEKGAKDWVTGNFDDSFMGPEQPVLANKSATFTWILCKYHHSTLTPFYS